MPKTVAPISHDAIKRSLKSKFKLILSENRILVETINGYVRRAEKVYKEMESTDDVTPKQFSKAMEKLERAYSACVRLILVASDLFEKGDSEGMKNRDAAASSCESETSVYSTESSVTITGSYRVRKGSGDKAIQRRSKSSDVRLNEEGRIKPRAHGNTKRSQTNGDLAEASRVMPVETANTASERVFVRPGGGSDFDHLIELQRFLHGLETEKLQTDHPSPCIAKEKQLLSYKIQRERVTSLSQGEIENKQSSSEESATQSLTQRLKILKSAIENFKDRSAGNERVNQALNDIRDLVLKTKEPKESSGVQEVQPDLENKDSLNSQISLASESPLTENRPELDDTVCCIEDRDQIEDAQQQRGNEEMRSVPKQSKRRENSSMRGKAQQATLDDGKSKLQKPPQPVGRKKKVSPTQQSTSDQRRVTEQLQQPQNSERKQKDELQADASPVISPHESENDRDDINHIIVNKIVDMVSAKLAPRLHMTSGEDRSGYSQSRAGKVTENSGLDESSRFQQCVLSPTHLACEEMLFPPSYQQGNCCGSYNHFSQLHRHHLQQLSQQQQQHQQQQQQETQALQRRQQRPKMVSFVEDYEDGAQYTWSSRGQYDSRQFPHDRSPSQVTAPFMYDEGETEEGQNYHSQKSNRFSSPNKKRIYSLQQQQPPQRCSGQQVQQQCLTLCRKMIENEDAGAVENETDLDKEEEESERADDSEIEVIKDISQYQAQDFHPKSTPSNESLAWANRPGPKNPSLYEDGEYCNILPVQRGQMLPQQQQQQQALHNNDSYVRRLPVRSPNTDNRQTSQAESQSREWFSPPQHSAESGSMEGNRIRPSEGDPVNRIQYHYVETLSHEKRQGDFSDWHGDSPDEHFSVNSEWEHKQRSPRSPVTHPQQQAEETRQFPSKAPRSTQYLQQPLPHHPISSCTNCVATQREYCKFKRSEVMHQTSESSCEASPVFSTDDRLQTDDMVSCREELGGKDTKVSRPEVVCIDAMQLHADASRTITLSNLPLDLDEVELLSIFKKYGHVTKIYYIKDRNTGLFQGRAYGKFSKTSEAFQAAQDLQKLVIDGHEITVQLYVNTA